MKIEHQNTLEKAFSEGINLFLGAGFSTLAKDRNNNLLPVGGDLVKELVKYFELDDMDALPLPQLCTVIESEQKDELTRYLRNRFSVQSFDNRYYNLSNINATTIFTTNIDDLVYKIYAKSKDHYLNDILSKGATFGERTAIDYVPLHGTVAHPSEEMVFSSIGLSTAFVTDPGKFYLLTSKLQSHPTLFWGYSLADASVLQALSESASKGRSHRDKWICLRKANPAAESVFKALGFYTIIADTEDLLDYLATLSRGIISRRGVTVATKDLFPEYAIPESGTTPVRSLHKFYSGAAPTWHDIFSNAIPKISHYQTVIDCIDSKSSGVFLGIPASGKTTLMMQVAAAYDFDGHKLVADAISLEKAQLIIKSLGQDKALIFLDNCSDNIEAFNLLANHPNIIIAGFDRGHDYESASHKIKVKLLKVFDIAGLNRQDQQRIFNAIPSSLRRQYLRSPRMVNNNLPSLYELLQENLRDGNLNKRYGKLLRDLGLDDQVTHDYLVMCTYVHSCRTPVSLDMALAFLGSDVSDYQEGYEVIQHIQSLVPDYEGELANEDQDYYMPRSESVSEAVMHSVSSESLKRVLLKFNDNVTPYHICHFNTFRRRAFTSDLAIRAFPKWQEGKAYFDQLYARDNSPYLLQQAALYFLDKGYYHEAFDYIDRALMQAGRKVFSIRNSHAIILFEANIIYAAKGLQETRASLDESMAILSECYRDDKRKQYHAIKFANLAVKYYKVYGDDNARQYLLTSKKWLLEEQAGSPWNRGIKSALRELEKASN